MLEISSAFLVCSAAGGSKPLGSHESPPTWGGGLEGSGRRGGSGGHGGSGGRGGSGAAAHGTSGED